MAPACGKDGECGIQTGEADVALANGVSLEALAHTCTLIVKPGPLDEKRAEAFLDLPAHEIYPMRIS